MSPRVTVIIPTYNWSSVLPYSIGSVLAQTMADFELLVVGDGCTDDSEQVVAAIGDPRVRWINIAHRGHQSGPNNEGLLRARGEIIAYLGHDDLWLPHHLALHVAAIDAGRDLSCSLGALVGPEDSFVECARPDLGTGSWMLPSAFVHRAAVTTEVGGWRDYRDMKDSPESELMLRVMAARYSVAVLPRLTMVKFPTSLRRNAYRLRPCHEQAAWLERIRSEPDLEAVLLGQLIAHPTRHLTGRISRAWRLLRHPSRWLAVLLRRNGASIRAYQQFKGVDHAAGGTKR